jgi:hypothetical protein
VVNPQQIADELRESAERGLTKFLALGSAAAASGIGAKISTVAPIEITGLVLMVGLGFFTFRALPVERRKLKAQIESSFGQLGDNFAVLLAEGIQDRLREGVALIRADLAPRRAALEGSEAALTGWEDRARDLSARIRTIREAIAARLPSA